MPLCRRFIAVLVLLLVLAVHTLGQVQTGIPTFGSFAGGPDVINLANLNSHIAIPVLQKSGRGLPFNFTLTYDGTFWSSVSLSGTQAWTPDSTWGWGVQAAAVVGYLLPPTVTQTTKTCIDDLGRRHQVTYTVTTYHRFRDPLGTMHPVLLALISGSGICNIDNGTASALTKDGSGWYLSVPDGTATTRMGHVYQLAVGSMAASGSATDTNGNQITSSNGTTFYDTLSGTTPALTVAGSATPSSPMTYSYTAPSGGTVSYTMKYTTYTVQTNFGCSGITEYGSSGTTTANLVSEIDLPDGSKYTFGYENTPGYSGRVTGRLASVTFPTGGKVTYNYTGANNGIVCADGTAAGLQRFTPDTGSNYWNYARTAGTGAAYTTTVTDPQGSVSTIQFQGIYETNRVVNDVHLGMLQTTNTCYNNASSPCTGTAITLPITQRSVSTQLAGSSNLTDLHTSTYDNYGDLLTLVDYDYAPSSHGAVLANTSIGYASLGSIVGLPATTIVTNGSTTFSQTIFHYDETSVQATSGTPQHVAVSGSRGNLTSVNYYTQGSTYLTKRYTYFDTGNVQTATDVNGAQTSYTYGACGNSFPTSASEPLSMSRSFAWNCTGGVQTSVTDENNQTASTTYNDPYFWRPNVVTDQLGNQNNFLLPAELNVHHAVYSCLVLDF